MIRLFIALIIPEEVIEKIFNYCADVTKSLSGHKWEPKEKIHLTLKFIGDIKEELLPEIIEDIKFVENYTSFKCSISKFGFFFKDNQARILWCNFETGEKIFELVRELNIRLTKFGIEAEKRKFKGHLTLLRIKNKMDEKFIQRFKEYKFDPIQFNSNKIVLVKSILKPGGSEYKVLKNYELN